ncbi:major facilitator superfamily domain-containing protein [Mucor lusitanicus]|uniref:Major facilitator superfamily domain-containing protein n=1 Tax=Mucor circinelloides f. lusitanicus TaxID=29924 RepID=A0A8H4B9C8_MUCCL|nr:major facilitator superfamily domain-containing protein [Mucor lusitanicus]
MIADTSAITIVDINEPKAPAQQQHHQKDEPYSVFSTRTKILIVLTVSISGFFSPFSTNIYFPALSMIEKDLNITERMVNLTVTMYMVFQGIAPSFWGSLADSFGRRPVYIMTFLIYLLACIGLACTRNYETLLSLRMLQAIGSSSAIAVGAGSIGDISTPAERGGYMGIYSMLSFLGPLVGPVLGGIFSHELGWRWIFWLLVIMVAPLWLVQIFLLPETLRSLVGNGSIYANPTPMQAWKRLRMSKKRDRQKETTTAPVTTATTNKALQSDVSFSSARTACCTHSQDKQADVVCISNNCSVQSNAKQCVHVSNADHSKSRWMNVPNPFQSLAYLKEKDVAVLLLYNSLQYAGLYGVLTSLTELFISIYGLNEFQVGLCFLSNGFGASIGSFTAGRLLNWKFHRIAKSLNMDEKYTRRGSLDPDFPIESARMGFTWIWGIAFSVAMIAYGWCLFYKVHIAVPITLNFLLSYLSTSTFTATNTLLVDLFPKNSAAIIASNNLTRCFLAAAVVMAVQPGIERLGVGWLFTLIALVLLVSRVSMIVLLSYGPKWRNQRLQRQQQQAAYDK